VQPLGRGQPRSSSMSINRRHARREPMLADPKLRKLLGKVFDLMRGDERKAGDQDAYKTHRLDFVFHMTDWLKDLEELRELYEHPEKNTPEEASTRVIGFLVHVLPHLNAAGRLLLDEVSDP